MPKSSTTALTFYPAYCFSTSPTFNTWAKLTIADIHGLRNRSGYEGQNLYFHLNHPIKWVRSVGVIVAFDTLDYRWNFQIDDGSGAAIEVTCPRERPSISEPSTTTNTTTAQNNPFRDLGMKGRTLSGVEIDMLGVDLGAVVKVKGGIGEFRGERTITLERITIVRNTTEEADAWNELHQFHSNILVKPWVITLEEQRKLKEEADGTRLKAEEKLRRRTHREQKVMMKRARADRDTRKEVRKQKRRTSDKENYIV
ncbi:hypothetical protein MMC19_002160 [Ptychographa xylographoides]|nr:hypothetical protein [Ptychographa xylographoides]